MSTSLNSVFSSIALAQGVEIGSNLWLSGGPPAFSGQTGGHKSYGWRHDFKLSPEWARAVIANYCSRPCFYDDAPKRYDGYRNGGRPVGWRPEDPYDLSNGERAYVTSRGLMRVSGPDLQHFWLDPLWTILDDGDDNLTVTVPQYGELPAHWIARITAQYLMRSLSGMVRAFGKYHAGGRPMARILDSFVQASKRGCVHPADAVMIVDWLDKTGLPFLESAPGVREVKGNGWCNWYQECGWMLLPLWEAEEETANLDPALNFPSRIRAIRERIGQWMLDIEAIAGGDGKWEQLRVAAVTPATPVEPYPSLDSIISPVDLRGQYSYSLWSVTAADVARADHQSELADAFFERVKARAFAEAAAPHKRAWLVDRNREWLVAP